MLNREETTRLLQAARGWLYEALVVLAVATGMRKGELLTLHGATWTWTPGL